MLRKLIAFIIVALLLGQAFVFSAANSNVQALYKMGFITGVQSKKKLTDYRLNSVFTKADAAFMMYKMSGGNLSKTAINKLPVEFKDVKRTHWAFPYITYCSQKGLLSGAYNGNFEPESVLTEKTMLTWLLHLLGYGAVPWDKVYETAFNAGLVDDPLYLTNPEDSTDYQRAQAFEVLFKALQLEDKTTGIKLINELISKGVIDVSQAKGYGLIVEDKQPTTIKSVVASEGKVLVTLNETVKAPLLKNIKIMTNDFTYSVKRVDVISGNQILLGVENLSKKSKFTLRISNIIDLSGDVTAELYYETVATKNETAPIDYGFFKVESVSVVSPKTIAIKFNRAPSNKAIQPLMYSIIKGETLFIDGGYRTFIVEKSAINNAILLSLKDGTFKQNESYILKVKGDLSSIYGEYLSNGEGTAIEFDTGEFNSYAPKLIASYLINSNKLELVFNYKMMDELALDWDNYRLIDSTLNKYVAISNIKFFKNELGQAVYVMQVDKLDSNKSYELIIKNLSGAFGESYEKDKSLKLKLESSPSEKLVVQQVNPMDKQTIYIKMSRGIWPENAPSINIDKLSIYRITIDSEDQSVLKIYLNSPMNLGQSYKIHFLNNVEDEFGNLYSIDDASCIGPSDDVEKLNVQKIAFAEDNRLVLSLSREVDIEKIVGTGRVFLTGTKNGIETKFICDNVEYPSSKVIILHFKTNILNQDLYDLKIDGIFDLFNTTPIVNYRFKS